MSNNCPKGTVSTSHIFLLRERNNRLSRRGSQTARKLLGASLGLGTLLSFSFSAAPSHAAAPARIDSVRVTARGRAATLRVHSSRPCRVVRTYLEDPERLVLDFSPARWTGKPPTRTGSRMVRTIRIAQHGAQRVRIVLETGTRPTRWTGRFRGAEWVGHGSVQEIRRAARNKRGAASRSARGSLRGLVIGIDPGHGGSDPGAISKCGLKEKDVTLKIAKQLRRLLQQQGARTLMTRRTDRRLPVATRKAFVAGSGADLIVSIHCDALEEASHCTGVTTYYHEGRRRSQDLAQAIQKRLPGATGLPNRGARPDTTIVPGGGFYVLRNAAAPAVLIETGYISCAATATRLRDSGFRQRVARGIVDGLRHYVGNRPVRSARR
jgi:N-acetylmuramoyl-L-alanine amidase